MSGLARRTLQRTGADADGKSSRSRIVYALLTGAVIVSGLASRRFAYLLPPLLHKNAGDILWATMVFLLLAWIWPRLATIQVAEMAAGFSLVIEAAKFFRAPWLDAVRATTAGRLVFGYSFSWSNLVCYAVGIAIAAVAEIGWRSACAGRSRRGAEAVAG